MPPDVLERLCAPRADARPRPRTLIVAAHPDDEVLGAGGRFARLGPDLHVVHLTDGSPRDLGDARREGFTRREEYAAARRREVECALALAGVPAAQARTLDAIDQEASLDLDGLSRRTADLIREVAPEAV